MQRSGSDVTLLLARVREGNAEAADELAPLIYSELRRTAAAYMRRERRDHTLQATGLVHEAYMRLIGPQEGQWQNRAHFFATAARTMRQILVDYSRRHRAGKRGGDARKVDFDDQLRSAPDRIEGVLAIDEILERLTRIDPRQSRVVELRFFGGLNVEETAEVMGVSPKTIKREWRSAKAWLHRELASGKTG